MKDIRHIAIIGSGRAAHYFAELFHAHGLKVDIISRNAQSGTALANVAGGTYSGDFASGSSADMILVCISDDRVESVLAQVPLHEGQIVCHCAGALDISILRRYAKHGVLYPIQSLGPELGDAEVPFLLEAGGAGVQEHLEQLLLACGKSFKYAGSDERRAYHMAAVFANNFTNAMLMATEDLAEKLKLDFDLLEPLIAQTFSRLQKHKPSEVQTGPARRNDKETIARHLALLSGYPDLQELYKNVSDYIMGREAME